MANVIERLQRPALILSHNKTLAAQLYGEFKSFFPANAVEYFVSYYDYYQPEAYIPSSDTYIEKDLSINDQIEKLRLSAASALLSGRRDVIVISSVSCLYGIGNPDDFHEQTVMVRRGERRSLTGLLYKLVDALYNRTEIEFKRGTFRVRGDTVDVFLGGSDNAVRIEFFGDEVDALSIIDPVTGARVEDIDEISIYPANNFVTTKERSIAAVSPYPGRPRQADAVLRGERPRARSQAPQAEGGIRPRDDQGDGLLPRHRELLPLLRRTQGGSAPVLPDRLLPQGLHNLHRREPRDPAADTRDVRRRPLPQVDTDRLRIPASRSRRQPSAQVRGVRGAHRPEGLRERDPRRLRTREIRRTRGRAARAPHRPAGPADRGAPHQEPGRRPRGGDTPAQREGRARARDHADQAYGRGARRLPPEDRHTRALHPLRRRHRRARGDHRGLQVRHVRRARRSQPAQGGARHTLGFARGDTRRRQGGFPAHRQGAHADGRQGRTQRQRPRDHVRRLHHPLDGADHQGDQPPAQQADSLQQDARYHAASDRSPAEHTRQRAHPVGEGQAYQQRAWRTAPPAA